MKLINKKLKVQNKRYNFIFSLFTFHSSLFAKTSLLLFTFHFSLLVNSAQAQSTNQNYPTAIKTNEINGKIVARDIGDSRLTSYFYVFNGNQGDVFINVQTSNFNGDIDVFTADNLKPLTKITIYADLSENETGRVIYLRKPEKLVLRIEGRSPNDDAATFKIKFAGEFVAMTNVSETDTPEVPQVKTGNQSDVRVNSVGTIIEVKPKPTPKPKVTIVKIEPKPKETNAKIEPKPKKTDKIRDTKEKTVEKKIEETDVAKNETNDNTKIIIEKQSEPEAENPPQPKTEITTTEEITKPKIEETNKENKPEVSAKITIEKTPEVAETKTVEKKSKPTKKPQKPKEPNPLENIHLIILFKDGTKIERPMSDVLKVSVDKGILTVISKDGSVGRYSILDVAKMTIE